MNKTKLFLLGFIILALIQIFVPLKMVIDREDILKNGKEFKFKTMAVDPYDLFRGKYITLNYISDNICIEQDEEKWKRIDTIYVIISQDKDGFAIIKSVSAQEPKGKVDFIKAKMYFISQKEKKDKVKNTKKRVKVLHIKYPFQRFYMDEFKAYKAEVAYRKANREKKEAYALIRVKKGIAVLKDVMIEGQSIREIVRKTAKK